MSGWLITSANSWVIEKPAQQAQWQKGEQDSWWPACFECVFEVSLAWTPFASSCASAQGTRLSPSTSNANKRATKRIHKCKEINCKDIWLTSGSLWWDWDQRPWIPQDVYYVGHIKGLGRIYQQTFIDTYTRVAFTKLYETRHAITSADLLDDKVPLIFEEQRMPLRVRTDRDAEYIERSELYEFISAFPPLQYIVE